MQRTLEGKEELVVRLVQDCYRTHGLGRTVNPPSYFLRFPDRPDARSIALPASLDGDPAGVDGIKWISSFPGNLASGLPRASAVLILNDPSTGYPFACLEASVISAVRTAASAALAADALTRTRSRPRRLGFVGSGLIARYVHHYLVHSGWSFDEVGVHDLDAASAAGFAEYLGRTSDDATITAHDSAEELLRASDLVVFATTAGEPHVTEPSWFDHHPVVLHVSLRDLSPGVIESSFNVVDDVEHCLKANTSVHLTEQAAGDRGFLAGTLHDVLEGAVPVPESETVVFSPFGLGVLDLAVGRYVHEQAARTGELVEVNGFFSELSRHG